VKYRRARKITHRISSVTNGFVQAILPDDLPDEADHARVLAILAIDRANLICAYCGDKAQHWDHLYPYVRGKRPSGYFNEARNLVPACGPCNTSKSGTHWRAWMFGKAKGSPTSRGVTGLEQRAALLDKLMTELELKPVDVESLISPELWDEYWRLQSGIENKIREAQQLADKIKGQLKFALKSRV
jgi:hypothetical protein